MEIYEQIRDARIASGLTQTQFGKKIGWVQPAVSRFEKGHMDTTIGMALLMAETLGKKIELR